MAGRARAVRAVGDSYTLFRRWQIDGTWARILKELQVKADAAGHLD